MLAGLVASPTKYAPHRNMELARERQRYVLGHMRDDNYISDAEYEAALAEPIALVDESDLNHLASPYFVEHVRQVATKRYGNRDLFKGGLKFYSTLDTRMQAAAEGALRKRPRVARSPARVPRPDRQRRADAARRVDRRPGAPDHRRDRRHRARSPTSCCPIRRYGAMVVELPQDGGVIVDLGPKRLPLIDADAKDVRAWRRATQDRRARSKLGDLLPGAAAPPTAAAVQLAQRPALQGAMVVMEPSTGRVLAMVGGYDWTASQFNRATQAKRQVGSSIKPFIYAAALEAGKTPVDRMTDGPFSVHDRDRRVDAGELRQQVHGRRHADDRARLLAQHDQRAARRRRSASIA